MAFHQIGPVSLFLLNDGELFRVGHSGRIGERHRAETIGKRQRSLLEVVGRTGEIDLVERRPVRLDREDRLDLIGPRIRHRPSEGAGLRVHHQDRRADLVDQGHQCIAVEELLLGEILDLRQVAGRHLQCDGVIGGAAARPLCMEMRLRPQLVLGLREVAALTAVAVGHLPGAV